MQSQSLRTSSSSEKYRWIRLPAALSRMATHCLWFLLLEKEYQPCSVIPLQATHQHTPRYALDLFTVCGLTRAHLALISSSVIVSSSAFSASLSGPQCAPDASPFCLYLQLRNERALSTRYASNAT